MAESIVINSTEELISVSSTEEILSFSGDEQFTLQDVSETISVSLVDNTTTISVTDVSETISAPAVEETLQFTSTEEVLDFTSTEPVVINTITQEITNNITNVQEVSELELPYNSQVDFVGDTHLYKGWADPGTATSAALWRIQKLTFVGSDSDVVVTWAAGVGTFTHIWDDRVSLSYS